MTSETCSLEQIQPPGPISDIRLAPNTTKTMTLDPPNSKNTRDNVCHTEGPTLCGPERPGQSLSQRGPVSPCGPERQVCALEPGIQVIDIYIYIYIILNVYFNGNFNESYVYIVCLLQQGMHHNFGQAWEKAWLNSCWLHGVR